MWIADIVPRLILLLVVCLSLGGQARAQTAPAIDPAVVAELAQAQDALRAAQPGPRARELSDAEIRAKLASLPEIKTKLAAAQTALAPRLADADARLAQLGPPPAKGQPPEPAATTASRDALDRLHQTLDGEVKLVGLLTVEADQTSRALVEQLHENFNARLWTRSRSVLEPALWTAVAGAAPDDLDKLADVAKAERGRFAKALSRRGAPAVIMLGLLAGLLLLGPARILLNRAGERRAAAHLGGSRLGKSALALWLVLVALFTPLLAGEVMRGALAAVGALTEDADDLFRVAIRVVSFAAALEGLGRALLSPGRRAWRLAPLGDEAVARLAPWPGLVAAAAGLSVFAAGLDASIGFSLPTSVAADCVTVLVEMAVTAAALLAMARIRRAARPAETASEPRVWWVLAALAAWLALAGVLAAVLAGYLALGTFLMRETIWIAAVLAALFISLRFTDDLFPALLSKTSASGRFARAVIGLSDSVLDQAAVLASGVVRLALLALGWMAILAPFGAGPADVAARITQARLAWKVGQTVISPATILGALAVLLVGLVLTRAVRSWMEARYLPKTPMDLGLRNTVAIGVSYLGAIVALVIAFAYLGLSFSQIALFASALSVGIGFGLQAVIGNFVSGLILLAERPIKVGDWVAIGDLEGDVKAINIRATEIEMADHSRLIVPNSDLVSKTVRNVTHHAAVGRVRIVLKVDGTADPKLVRDIILARLKGHGDVLAEPPPGVFLTDARDGALEFTAIGYVTSPRYAFRVKSDLLFGIVPDLRAQGVALATSGTVVNVGYGEPRPQTPGDEAPADT